jgi:tetratricopeptide (TPR) repeat protein
MSFMPAVLAAGLFAGPGVAPAVETTAVVAPTIIINDARLGEQAYAYNRDGMIAMSKAQFDEAIEQFQHAATLVPDYGITRRELRYTPNFMIGWAHEKQGRIEEACRAFRRFLDLAPPALIEQGKADHAGQYLGRHCPTLQPRPQAPGPPELNNGHGL